MAVIDDYFFELEKRMNKAESEFEFEVLQKEIRKIYFPPEARKRRKETKRREYQGELMRYYIDKARFVSDLKDIGMSYHALAKGAGIKAHFIQKDSKGHYINMLDNDCKKLKDIAGLDIKSYTLSTEPAGRQPQRPINVGPIKKALETKDVKKYQLSMDLYNNGTALDTYIEKKTMPIHRAKELCDVLGLEHSEVIIKEN